MKDKKILIVTSLVLLLLLTTGLSYAYFSTAVKGNGNAKDMVVEAGTLKLTYIDGPAINVQNIKPGWSTTKEVSVKNNGTLDAYYNIIWQSLTNGITNDELVLSATCQRLNTSGTVEGTCEPISQAPISDMTITKKISIESGITHKYTFTFLFKEINADQNYNQGKQFNGVLGIEEYKDTAVYCTFDGELTQGAEYVNGQYTYRYMQESGDGNSWNSIMDDGWGVKINDYTADIITSKLCTYINDKPIVSMSNMFHGALASFVDSSSFDTSNVKNMTSMFTESKIKDLDFNNFNTSNVIDMSEMFAYSRFTSLDLSSFDTSNVIDMHGMFYESISTVINGLGRFDTSNVKDMTNMFNYSQATTLDVSNFDTSNVTNMSNMFSSSQATTLDVSSFDTSSVTDMGSMFYNSKAITLDLSNFDTSNVENMSDMFASSANLKTIYVSSEFNADIVINGDNMFYECFNLVGGAGTTWDSNHTNADYAHIDGGEANPGYFTDIADKK